MMDVPFVVVPADVDESVRPNELPNDYLGRVVTAKLEAVRRRTREAASRILVADTVVVAPDGAILAKPADERDARVMLQRLAGATHEVSTRFALAEGKGGTSPRHVETVRTRVTFRALAPDELDSYARGGEGNDKAGGYALQGRASVFVERIDGSYANVVGLPVCEVVVAMRTLGWQWPTATPRVTA
jgi:septum formation protein